MASLMAAELAPFDSVLDILPRFSINISLSCLFWMRLSFFRSKSDLRHLSLRILMVSSFSLILSTFCRRWKLTSCSFSRSFLTFFKSLSRLTFFLWEAS